MRSLGFNLPAKAQGAPAPALGTDGIGNGTVGAKGGAPKDRVLVEACCEPNSKLSKATRWSKGCEVIPITEKIDFGSAEGIQHAISNIKGPKDWLWYSSPCTGGSLWQRINVLKGGATEIKIRYHCKLMKRLWKAFEVVASHALSVGARVFIEWPRGCSYWKDSRVVKFLNKHGFVFADFDGCMYGLVAERGPNEGQLINKPWRVACSPNSSLPKFLNKKCDGSHDHTPCSGVNTLGTQGYTDMICGLVHQSICHDNKEKNQGEISRVTPCCM